MRIIIADDHFLVLDGLELLLSTFDFVKKTSRSSDLSELNKQLQKEVFDLLLLDIRFGKHDGRELIATLKKDYPLLKIIALTSQDDQMTIQSSAKAGFDGYLLKIDGREEIEKALKAVYAGEKYFSPMTHQAFFKAATSPVNQTLTPRETEILQLIVQEKSSKEIAEQLHLSEKTIETHRGNIMMKLEVKNIAGMVRSAIMNGLVSI
ncbi:LuxR C-terminal-related transcriptional regulator [Algoriphagus sp. PAP.12]|uniref:LuxR C-terminal-related transcriptional regulator n=1 Tax=Algoriphagus sp. PAP.12 TaxID=2996678 RepID=UPI00227C7FE0|nr:response regulator transcription factor [Algoriphagus sp. PAP.12]